MGGNPHTLGKYLDGARREADLDRLTGKTVGHAVVVTVDIDVIIDADPPGAPFGEHIGLGRQGLEAWPIKLFKQVATFHADPADGAR